ncbi:uncharacterized protein LOC132556581 [Ylistrum balloti]|uniref:uncharacterized protein LOC132556581 n=1 Tax=Ylistrum balloti TaxID=509963 RepID=UPI002905D090|nr:uncharacterized protein LOC132556581 [Ylistrum balloti]
MASSMIGKKGFRTLQILARNKIISRQCQLPKNIRCVNLHTNQFSKRFHQARISVGTSAMIGVFAAVGLTMVECHQEGGIKEEILQLIGAGKHDKNVGELGNNFLISAKDKAHLAFKLGLITEEERCIVIVLSSKLMGEKYLQTGQVARAESCFVEAMEAYKRLGIDKYDDASLELVLRLTNCFAVSGREIEAKDSFDMIIDTQLRKIKESKTKCPLSTYQILWATLQLYGRFLVMNKEYDEAENMFFIADDVMQKASGEDFHKRIDILTDLAGIKIVKQDFTGAEETFEKAIRIGEKENAPEVCFTYCYMADLATRMNEFDKATEMCDKGLKLAEKLHDAKCHEKASLYLEKLKEAKQKR